MFARIAQLLTLALALTIGATGVAASSAVVGGGIATAGTASTATTMQPADRSWCC
jgi:hypothetical protein